MRCNRLHRREPDVPALKNLRKEAVRHFQARKASGGEGMHDRHPERAYGERDARTDGCKSERAGSREVARAS